jgi:hypothetical protein
VSDSEDDEEAQQVVDYGKQRQQQSGMLINNSKHRQHGSKGALPSPLGSANSFDVQVCGKVD